SGGYSGVVAGCGGHDKCTTHTDDGWDDHADSDPGKKGPVGKCGAGVKGGGVAHECILDLRPLKETSGVSAEDVAKRL
ncbi:hypothetical protein P8631_23545, partial [Guyparkeria sp. 1SP6A2]|nr:hypothetical protein [Guyparkeria sp. 1SP6A2]